MRPGANSPAAAAPAATATTVPAPTAQRRDPRHADPAANRGPAPNTAPVSSRPHAPIDDTDIDSPRSRARPFIMGGLLAAMILGSGAYLITHKDDVMALAGIAPRKADVPVVKVPPTVSAALDKKPAAPPPPAAIDAAPAAPAPVATPAEPAAPSASPTPQQSTQEMVPSATAPPPAAPSRAHAELDTRYQKSPLWALLKRDYADWYDQQMTVAAGLIDQQKTERDATEHMVKALVDLRRRNAEAALKADTPKLVSIADAFLINLKALSERGPDTCYGFISQGEASPASIDLFNVPRSAPALENQVIAIFEAIAAGNAEPTNHPAPQKGDYDVLAAELGKLGWSQADLQLFADPKALSKAAPDRVCKMVGDWFSAHIAISDEAVKERLLKETLRPVVAG
jgi:hypothetical protein